jgi:hypothetical protein
MRIVAGVGDLMQRTRDGHTGRILGGRAIETLCAVYTVHIETRSMGFLVEPQNQGRQFSPVWPQNWWLGFPGMSLKIGSSGLVILVSESPQWFLGLGLKIRQTSVC